MAAVLRHVGAVVAGIVVALVLVVAVEGFSAVVHPFPPDFDSESPEAMCEHVERYPAWVLAVVVPMWGTTALAGTWIAGWLGSAPGAVFVGVLLVAMVVLNLSMLPYPIWFKVACPIAIPAASLAGVYLGTFRKSREPIG